MPDDQRRFQIEIPNEAAMSQLGERLAKCAQSGLVVGLIGNLGAGKTRLVQATAAALGVDRSEVNSPTFVLIQEYEGRIPVYHFDTYRLHDEDEFLELGADEYMSGDGICFIEWADRMADVLPRDRLTIEIEITGEATRRIQISSGGPRSAQALDSLGE